jgi:SPP1 gp7 family putative phage head morphogenesis protein
MTRFKERVMEQAAPVMKRMYAALGHEIQSTRVFETQAVDRIEDLKVHFMPEIKQILKKHMREAYEEAYALGSREILRHGQYKVPVPNRKFLEFVETEASLFVDDLSENVRKGAKVRVLSAIKDGKPLSSIFDVLNEEELDNAEVSIERFARTKFTEIMNRGRLAFFEDSGVVAAYQYSAILDDRTTEICEGLHGKVFASGEQPIPPLHFNCRSLLIPITRFEDWEADTKVGNQPIGKFIEENKGKGFARYSLSDEPAPPPENYRPPLVLPDLSEPGTHVKHEYDSVTAKHTYTYFVGGKPVCARVIAYDENEELLSAELVDLRS